jgi:hypothetical protein
MALLPDFFYAKNMQVMTGTLFVSNGALVPYVAHRSIWLRSVKLSSSVRAPHIEGGDFEMPKRAQIALPGATFELDRLRAGTGLPKSITAKMRKSSIGRRSLKSASMPGKGITFWRSTERS